MGKKKQKKKKQQPPPRTIPVEMPVAELYVPPEPEEDKAPLIKGRTLRAWVGLGIIVVVAGVFVWDHVVLRRSFEALEITGQALLFGVGFLLIDKKLFAEFKGALLSRLGKK